MSINQLKQMIDWTHEKPCSPETWGQGQEGCLEPLSIMSRGGTRTGDWDCPGGVMMSYFVGSRVITSSVSCKVKSGGITKAISRVMTSPPDGEMAGWTQSDDIFARVRRWSNDILHSGRQRSDHILCKGNMLSDGFHTMDRGQSDTFLTRP